MNYEIFGSAIQTVMPDRGLRRRGFASGVEVPVQDLDAYVKGLFKIHDPRASLFTERTWSELGATLAAAAGGFRLMAPVDADGGGGDYLYITAAGNCHRNSMVTAAATALATGLSGATSFTRWPTAHVVFIAGKPRHSINNGVSFSSDWTQTGAQDPTSIWLDESGQVLLTRAVVYGGSIFKYPTLADAAANTNATVMSAANSIAGLNVVSKIGGDVVYSSSSGNPRKFKLSGLSLPTFEYIAQYAVGSFVGGFEHLGNLWWKETSGAKRLVSDSFGEMSMPFTWTSHQAFFKCGAYMFDLSDNILRYSIDGEEWLIHSSGRANSDVQAAGRRLFYSSDSSTYVHKFTGLL